MIVQQKIQIGGKAFVRTYSDEGMFIERRGVRLREALDPEDSGRVYFQTQVPAEGGEKLENNN